MTNHIKMFFFVAIASGFFCLMPMLFSVPNDYDIMVTVVQVLSLTCLALIGSNAK
ncbi:hypothetical protein M2H03_20195 [Vibrio vulnificus]|nr:hypothetical protein [Vibrio vulnificus]